MYSVHPHARGEHSTPPLVNVPFSGSSPRTWGTLGEGVDTDGQIRFIPTHVGNTGRHDSRIYADPVHPHARGEHFNPGTIGSYRHGSSPRTWGTHKLVACSWMEGRFIPTHVGNTGGGYDLCPGFSVHPHARGEHFPLLFGQNFATGSSPRTWGTPHQGKEDVKKVRFIPTHVGNTVLLLSAGWFRSVHPHARGEHFPSSASIAASVGSSPRTWGTLERPGRSRVYNRFIPTHVGNTFLRMWLISIGSVHPHARGEHVEAVLEPEDGHGSSPRTWGTPPFDVLVPVWPRFIPTHVGNTSPGLCPEQGEPVHPHARGEHASCQRRRVCLPGSSPRTWGTLIREGDAAVNKRFIPTHVGNTRCEWCPRERSPVHPHARGEHGKNIQGTDDANGSSPRTWGTRCA